MNGFLWNQLKQFLSWAHTWIGQQTFTDINVTGGSIAGAVITDNFTTITDPAINAAVTTAIVDSYNGIVVTLTAAGNAQTLQAPTSSTVKRFVVINNDTSTHSIVVNGITLTAGKGQPFVYDGSAWGPSDIGITSIPVPVAEGGTGLATITDHGVMLGSDTDPVTPMAVGATGEVIAGQTGADPIWSAAPTIGTSVTVPTVYGSSAENGDITIEGTSHATKTTSNVVLQPTEGNVGIGTTTFGTSAAKVLAMGSGTAPTTSPADAAQMWVADSNSVAGAAAFYMRNEVGKSGAVAFKTLTTKTVSTTPVTLTANEIADGLILVTTGASVINLPAGDATLDGAPVKFRSIAAVAFSVYPNGSQVIDLAGTDLTGGNKITSDGTAGVEYTLVWDNTASKWRTLSISGTVIDGGA